MFISKKRLVILFWSVLKRQAHARGGATTLTIGVDRQTPRVACFRPYEPQSFTRRSRCRLRARSSRAGIKSRCLPTASALRRHVKLNAELLILMRRTYDDGLSECHGDVCWSLGRRQHQGCTTRRRRHAGNPPTKLQMLSFVNSSSRRSKLIQFTRTYACWIKSN